MGRTMERRGLKQARLIACDLDGTVLGDDASLDRFRTAWNMLSSDARPLLVYSSGRLLDDMAQVMASSGLPEPDFMFGGVGTLMEPRRGSDSERAFLIDEFKRFIGPELDQDLIAFVLETVPGVTRQPARFQHPYKSSWFLHDAGSDLLRRISAALAQAGLNVQLVYSSERDLDVLPVGADKGNALAWLCRELEIGLDEVIVAGDSGNDAAMFILPEVRGIIVANARAELLALEAGDDRIFRSGKAEADGVVEGLVRWGVLEGPEGFGFRAGYDVAEHRLS